jgi:predicted DNA-binding transcriptional regulator YafY
MWENYTIFIKKDMATCGISFKQYLIIIERCSNGLYPSKESILNSIEIDDKKVSYKTLERRFQELKYEFGIEIKFDRGRMGYYVVEQTLLENKEVFNRINNFYINDIILANNKLNFIGLDDEENYSGIKNIKPLIEAISTRTEISFMYSKEGSKPKEVIVRPWYMKQFEKMWYVASDVVTTENETNSVGTNSAKFHRTYALDRISNIKETGVVFRIDEGFNPTELYKHLIGINYNESLIPVKIIIEINRQKSHLLQNLPLHQSQKKVLEDNDIVRFELFVKPNQELINRLIRYIDLIKIIEPEELKQSIKKVLKKGLDNLK